MIYNDEGALGVGSPNIAILSVLIAIDFHLLIHTAGGNGYVRSAYGQLMSNMFDTLLMGCLILNKNT